jgi:bidirectional [NiFe] hydrogenase diaphorase subunit
MKEIQLQIDGKEVRTLEGTTVLAAARSAGIAIPTLCHHERLAPLGACRMCIVEASRGPWKKLVAACVSPAEEGWVVQTRSEKIDRFRRSLLELMLARAPQSPPLQEMAREYGADPDRFEKDASFCIHCGLCVRYCAEVKQKHAIGFIDRGIRKEISFIPEIAAAECDACQECFPLCPTSYLQAAYVLTQSLVFPSTMSTPTGSSSTASAGTPRR